MFPYIVVAILAVAVLGIGIRRSIKNYFTFRGVRLLACPESRQPAAVTVEPWRAALTGFWGAADLKVQDCSRWPESVRCEQTCVAEIRAAPAEHQLNAMLVEWCHDRPCSCCGTPLHRVHVGAHRPHLMSVEHQIIEWKDIKPQDLPRVLGTCEPVCEHCLAAETHIW